MQSQQGERLTTATGVRILHTPEDTSMLQSPFDDPIPGNRGVHCGALTLGRAGVENQVALRCSFVVTEPGAIFPCQYHTPGTELAFIVAGQGAIEVGEHGGVQDTYPFAAGDLVLIGPDLFYQVRNTSASTPLYAWVAFPEGTESFWPDGTKA